MKKLAVFDFDSTLMDGETIDFLARAMKIQDEISAVTKRAMRGEMDFYQSLKYRVSLLKNMPLTLAKEVCENLPLMNGGKELIEWLKSHGYVVVVFSGGFRLATSVAQEKLHFDADFSNILHHQNGLLTGDVGGEMMFADSKGEMLKRLQAILSVSIENTLVVGDGANDLSMFAYATKRVAFCAKPILKDQANIIIDDKDLKLVIPHLI